MFYEAKPFFSLELLDIDTFAKIADIREVFFFRNFRILSRLNSMYRTRAIISRGLYTFYPLFEVHLCTVTFGLMYG